MEAHEAVVLDRIPDERTAGSLTFVRGEGATSAPATSSPRQRISLPWASDCRGANPSSGRR